MKNYTIKERIAILEEIEKERWDAHEKRSKELKDWIEGQFEGLRSTINSKIKIEITKLDLPCDVHRERMSGMKAQINWLWIILGIAVLGGMIKFFIFRG